MEQQIIEKAHDLRVKLHSLAERSNEEKRTKAYLIEFLRTNTSLRIDDFGAFFFAVHEESGANGTLAFRADMDALPVGDGAEHLCGHDGHCAVLAALGIVLENRTLGRNIVLIFQHAEEIGEGALVCAQALKKYHVDRVYAFHNIPAWSECSVLLRNDTFACASRGMSISFSGEPSHAAYPENGKNSGYAAARLISSLPEITDKSRYCGLTMATLIGAEIGSKAFGSAASNSEIWLTLRAWNDDELESLINTIKETAKKEAKTDRVEVTFSFCEVFPATVNDNETLAGLKRICSDIGLDCIDVPEPFRWSEDFGHYSSVAKTAMFGIGAGVDWPQLHTENFIFNDNILHTALKLFTALAEFG